MKKLLFVFALSLVTVLFHAQNHQSSGTEFWLGFMENLELGVNGDPSFSIIISSKKNASGTIAVPSTGFNMDFTIISDEPQEFFLPGGTFYPTGSETIEGKGIKIISDEAINVYAMHYRLYFSEASIVLPINELGKEYRIIAHEKTSHGAYPSQLIVVATKNNTTIEITPTALTAGLKPAGVPFSINLNAGEVYQIQSTGDLTGSLIKSNTNKIAVFSGSKYTTIGCNGATSHTYDQNYPIKSWGTEYAIMPIQTQGDPIKIIASEDQTSIQFNCVNMISLDKGENYYTVLNDVTYVTSNKPICIAQLRKGGECGSVEGNIGDPNMLILPPVSFQSRYAGFNSSNRITMQTSNYFNFHYLNILTKTNSTSSVYLDEILVTSFIPFPSAPNYSYALITLNPGYHNLESDSGFYAYSYGSGDHDAYTYFLGYDHIAKNEDVEIFIDPNTSTCENNEIRFESTSAPNITEWNWNYGDGGTANSPNPTHAFSNAGNYLVNLSYTAEDECYHSTYKEVTISACNTSAGPYFIPNIFSPNGDGTNDEFNVIGSIFETYTLKVFDRWGINVFTTKSLARSWDGTFNGKTLDSDVFIYLFNGITHQGEEVRTTGNITLIR